MKEALRRAIAIRDGINRKTGVNDKTITDGVNKLSHDKTIILPQLQIIDNPKDTDVIFDNDPFETLEYIESTGTQYIKTGYTPNVNTKIIFDFECVSTTGSSNYPYYFGAEASNNSNRFGLWQNSSYLAPRYTPISENLPTSLYPINNRYVVEFSNGKVYINNQEILSNTTTITLSNVQLYLFAMNNNNNSSITSDGEPSKIRLYSCQIYDNEILVRDYLPKRDKYTSVLGMYDSVRQLLDVNAGSGDFIPGPVISGGD